MLGLILTGVLEGGHFTPKEDTGLVSSLPTTGADHKWICPTPNAGLLCCLSFLPSPSVGTAGGRNGLVTQRGLKLEGKDAVPSAGAEKSPEMLTNSPP